MGVGLGVWPVNSVALRYVVLAAVVVLATAAVVYRLADLRGSPTPERRGHAPGLTIGHRDQIRSSTPSLLTATGGRSWESGHDVAVLGVLRRDQTPADREFAAAIGPKIAGLVKKDGLNLGDARRVLSNHDGFAGLIPGNGTLCFVSYTSALGTSSVCIPPGWAAKYGGFGTVGSVGQVILVQGVVPDNVVAVQFTDAYGSATYADLNLNHAYSQFLKTRPVHMTYRELAGEVTVYDLSRGGRLVH